MKVIAFNGSARKDGNTATMINWAFEELEAAGVETELIQLAGQKIRGCTACNKCWKNKDRRCAVKNDILNDCLAKFDEADGAIIGSPVYFADLTSETKALVDRFGMVGLANEYSWKRKVGAAAVAVRRAGAVHTFDSINHLFQISQMIIPGSSYWNVGFGRDKGEVAADKEAERTMRNLGLNMAWLLKKLKD